MKLHSLLALVFVANLAFAADNGPFNSAHRRNGEGYREARQRTREMLKKYKPTMLYREGKNAYDAAVPIDKLDFSKVAVWDDNEKILAAFRRVRDERFIDDDRHTGFARRSTWLYPYDGCWARAALAGIRIEKWSMGGRPAKLFIFGNLNVNSTNAGQGPVHWWYHVVPVLLDKEHRPVVFDPAINPRAPMSLKAWVASMTDKPESVTLSVCSPITFGPHSDCSDTNHASESGAMSDQKRYLQPEWQNLVALKRNPEKELGEFPNWNLPQRRRPN